MDIKSVKIDSARGEKGDMIGDIPRMGDLRLGVRSFNNADYQAFMAREIASVPPEQRVGGRATGALKPEIRDALIVRGTVEHVLFGWENLTEGGVPIPYSKEAAMNFLADPDYRPFREAVDWACAQVEQIRSDGVDSVVGNS